MRGVVRPVRQGDDEPLKTEASRTPLPIPQELALELSAAVARWGGEHVVTDGTGRQTSTWAIERAIRSARPKVPGLPEAFRFHDLRHYLASLLIGSGLDVKVVQHRLRHGSAETTLDTYGHMWPRRPASRSTRRLRSSPRPLASDRPAWPAQVLQR
jgi:integrase